MAALSLDFKDLRRSYTSGLSPSEVIQRLYPRIAAEHGMFITLLPLEDLLDRCRYAVEPTMLLGQLVAYGKLPAEVLPCMFGTGSTCK